MKTIFLPPADKELEEAIRYYNSQLDGLGDQFHDEVIATIKFIQRFPQAWQKVGKHTKKCIIRHFSYFTKSP